MIRRAVFFLAVCGMCVASTGEAADLPSYTPKKITSAVKTTPKPQKAIVKPRRVAGGKPLKVKSAPKTPKATIEVAARELDLSWVLDPLVANADGAKREDSASIEANLVVTEPGNVSQPLMVIEMTGHVVKTARTTARLDIRVGSTQRTVSWNSGDVQSGRFSISLNAPISEGQLPDYFPVSALAFVTQDGKDGAAMISLEKVVLRFGKVRVAGTQKDPATSEVTGSISAD